MIADITNPANLSMARQQSPVRLRDHEARRFRSTIREIRDAKGLDNNALAEHLKWKERRVVDALTNAEYEPGKQRPLLAENALDIRRAVDELESVGEVDAKDLLRYRYRLVSMLDEPWVKRYEQYRKSPAVLIPTAEISDLRDMLTKAVIAVTGVNASRKEAVAKAIERALQSRNHDMAMQCWGEILCEPLRHLTTSEHGALVAFLRKQTRKRGSKRNVSSGKTE